MNKIFIDLFSKLQALKVANGNIESMLNEISDFMGSNAIPAVFAFKDAINGKFELPKEELLAFTLMEYIGSIRKLSQFAHNAKDTKGEELCVDRLAYEIVILYKLLEHVAEKQKEN